MLDWSLLVAYTPFSLGGTVWWGTLQLLLEENGLFDHKCDDTREMRMMFLSHTDGSPSHCQSHCTGDDPGSFLPPILYTQFSSCPVYWQHVVLDRSGEGETNAAAMKAW